MLIIFKNLICTSRSGVKLCREYKTVHKSAYLTHSHSHTKWNSFATTLLSQHLHSLFWTGIFLKLHTSILSGSILNRNWANSDRLCLEIIFLRYSSVCKTLWKVTYVLNFGWDNISVFHFSFIFWVKRLRSPLIFIASRVSNTFRVRRPFFTHIDLSYKSIFFVNLVWSIRVNLFQNLILMLSNSLFLEDLLMGLCLACLKNSRLL